MICAYDHKHTGSHERLTSQTWLGRRSSIFDGSKIPAQAALVSVLRYFFSNSQKETF
jgi:hypothetical protein